ncbi:unnamed protein product [Ilex paraguariensis]|uniref:Uncharacterized protein n=1 Tax=Ilex paraguariensis TaxID=185542 RepID=A0ABC8TPA0_9AQUA
MKKINNGLTKAVMNPTPETLSNQWLTIAVMKDLLRRLYFYGPDRFPVLFQFWTPKSKGGNWVLTTSDQPFGVKIFHKGLAACRSYCVHNNYVISDNKEGDIGPHLRVFRGKCLEWITNVGCYSVKEYPQQQYAIFVAYGDCWLCH